MTVASATAVQAGLGGAIERISMPGFNRAAARPTIRGGLPMDVGGVGHGVADLFVYQTRAFLEQIAGSVIGPRPGFDPGLHGLPMVAAITESAQSGGVAVKVA
jgi:hypothetical protein